MKMLGEASKKYDITEMNIDLNKKMEHIVLGIRKEEKVVANNEQKMLRNLDRLDYMSQYLQEDHVLT